MARRRTTDAVKILRKRYFEGNPERLTLLEQEKAEIDIAQQLYALRVEKKLTQADLAELVGTTSSAISRLENADYSGHSLAMLRRIANAVGKAVKITFIDKAVGNVTGEDVDIIRVVDFPNVIHWKQTKLYMAPEEESVHYSRKVEHA